MLVSFNAKYRKKSTWSQTIFKMGYVKWMAYALQEALVEQEFFKIWSLLKPELLKVTDEDFVQLYEKDFINSNAIWFRGGSFIGKQKTIILLSL